VKEDLIDLRSTQISTRFSRFLCFAAGQCQRRHYIFTLSIHTAFFHSFVWTDLITMIAHERLEQSRWNLQWIFTGPYYWPE